MILVFGKTGQVAMELQRFEEVVSLSRNEADLKDPELCAEIIRSYSPDIVINAAAYTDVDSAESNEIIATNINANAPIAMSKACANLSIPFIHISTDYVFDGTGINPWKVLDQESPINAYGRSKLKGEEGICNSGAIYAILRTSWVISSFGSNFVKTMLRISKNKDKISIISDQVGGPTPASDIASACIKIGNNLKSDPSKAGIYHFSGTPDVSWYEFACEIFRQADIDILVLPILTADYPTPASRPLNSRLECSDIKDRFDILRPKWKKNLKQIIKELGS